MSETSPSWNIGNGRWIWADCFDAMASLPDASIDMILCDLPYGTTRNKWDSVLPLDRLWREYRRVAKSNAAIVLTSQTPFDKVLGSSNLGWLRYEWIWQKSVATGHLNAKYAPMKEHENVLVFYDRTPTYNPQMRSGFKPYRTKQGVASSNYGKVTPEHVSESSGDRYPRSVLSVPSAGRTIHPTQKPVALFEYLIRTYTNPGDLVLDNTAGSGTTAIAAENAGRRWVCIERDLDYTMAALDRIEGHLAK